MTTILVEGGGGEINRIRIDFYARFPGESKISLRNNIITRVWVYAIRMKCDEREQRRGEKERYEDGARMYDVMNMKMR